LESSSSNDLNGKITEAHQYFTNKINQKSISFCESLKSIILEKLVVVNITSGENDNPYLIFESLNNKGQELTQADLVRNYIFMKLPNENREKQYNKLWLPLENKFKEQVGEKYSGELTNAFWCYLRKDGQSVSKKSVYQSLKKRCDNCPDKLQQELESLVTFSHYYECFNFPEKEESNNVLQRYFENLKTLDFKTSHIFLLNVYHDYQNSKVSESELKQILIYLESYFVRRLFSGVSTRVLGKIFNTLYSDIKKQKSSNIVNGLYEILDKFEADKRWPTDEEFREGLINHKIYNKKTSERTKFILEKLEKKQGKETVDFSNLTIEHIMPQTLDNEWINKLGNDESNNYKTWLHTLGNLTVTGYNSELSNKPYSQKIEYLKDSNLYLNRYFKDINDWNFDTIKERANKLADTAIQVWPRQPF
ncbi:MAG: HNH endonuclease family protein, partial [Crocosphaera sp.]